MSRILIVGGVAGGMSAAARLRRLDEKAEIIVFEKGEYISYANCGLPYYIGGSIKSREKLLVQTVESFNKRFNVEIRIQSEVKKIDRENKKLIVKNLVTGNEYAEGYDSLILSPGAEPVKPPIPGIDNPGIFTLRSIPDTDKIKDFIDTMKPERAVIIGAGFIGLEMAENLHGMGISVAVVEMAEQVMNAVDFEMASIVHQHLKTKKIKFYLGAAVSGFANSGDKLKVRLTNGKELESDMVILSIGVKPDTKLAKEAGLTIGGKNGIKVNEYMQTSDENIYAIGDAVETMNPVTGKTGVFPLAGPANKQGRIAADNIINGNIHKYRGTTGTAIAKVFDLSVAVTGATGKLLKAENIPFMSVIIHPSSHASYYPGSMQLSLKLLFSPDTGRILGAQAVGTDGADKRIDVIAASIMNNDTVYDLQDIEHSYAPPYSSAKDPVNMAGFVAENAIEGKNKIIYWDQVDSLDRNEYFILDVRTPEEFRIGTIKDAVNIPVDSLRTRINEIPDGKKIAVFCRVGLRGYIGARILEQNGFHDVYNLTGGYLTYSIASQKQDNPADFEESIDTGLKDPSELNLTVNLQGKTINVDASGLQCPGPIMRVKNEMDKAKTGDRLNIKATDPGFYNDLPAWTKATGHKIVSLDMEKGIINAVVEKSGEAEVIPQSVGQRDKTIVVFDGDLDRAIAAFIITNGALSMGRNVTMFFTFWGLNILKKNGKVKGMKKNLIEKLFAFMLPRGSKKLGLSNMNMAGLGPFMIRGLMKSKKIDSLESMMESAIKNGAKLIACQMSMDLMGVKREELIDGIEIGGVATYLEAAEHADTNLFI